VALRQVDLGIELQILSFYQEHQAAAAAQGAVAPEAPAASVVG
jgi:hypothetical protein